MQSESNNHRHGVYRAHIIVMMILISSASPSRQIPIITRTNALFEWHNIVCPHRSASVRLFHCWMAPLLLRNKYIVKMSHCCGMCEPLIEAPTAQGEAAFQVSAASDLPVALAIEDETLHSINIILQSVPLEWVKQLIISNSGPIYFNRFHQDQQVCVTLNLHVFKRTS